MSKFNDQVNFWAHMLDECMNEASADDILAKWNARQTEHKPSASDETNAAPIQPKRFISYAMGNDTHELYAGDWIIGMYMQKDEMYAAYAIYRMSKLTAHKFKSLKGKHQTSTLKTFLTNNAELIEKDDHGRWTLDKFINEMKRIVGPSHYDRQPVLFTAGLNRTNYHYDRNPAHRGKTTMTTQTTGHVTYDLDNFKFDASTFQVHSGRSKQHQMSFGGGGSKLPRQKVEEADVGQKLIVTREMLDEMNGNDDYARQFAADALGVTTFEDVYAQYISDEAVQVDGQQRDVDDFDVWEVNFNNAIGIDAFADAALDRLTDELEHVVGREVTDMQLKKIVDQVFSEVAEHLEDNVDIEQAGICVYKGKYHTGGYYPDH